MGILDRDTAFAVADPALSSLFIVRVPFAASLIEIVVETISATVVKIPAQARFTQGSNQYYPGTADIDGLSITFYETHDRRVSKWLHTWSAMIYNPATGYYGLPIEYKKQFSCELYSQANSSPIETWVYNGCWPTDVGPYELSYNDETGRTTVQAQFSVDERTVK